MNNRYGSILATSAALSGLYLLAVMPRMTNRADPAPFNTKFFAHRGLHDNGSDAPENSMAAFRKAVDAGYGIELDVQLSADRIPVIFHDPDLKRVCGVSRQVRDCTFAQLQEYTLFGSSERIPALEEFLRMVDGRQAYNGVYCIESFNPLVLLWYRIHRPEVMRGQLSDGFLHIPKYRTFPKAPATISVQFLLPNFLSKPDFIAYNHLYEGNLSRRICRSLYKAKSAAWTIRSEKELKMAAGAFDVFIFDSFIPKLPGGQ